MRICFLTYNFPRDYALANALHSHLHAHYSDATFIWCIESKDVSVPVPEGIQPLVRDFNRGGNLRYTEALHAMSRIYAELAEQFDIIVKLDADTFLVEPCAWTDYIADGGDIAYIPHAKNRATGNGCCYALSSRAARFFSGLSPAEFDARSHQFGGREDMFFTGNAINNPAFYSSMIPRNRVSWCDLDTQPGRNAIAAHLGYLTIDDIETRISEILGKPFMPLAARDYTTILTTHLREHNISLPERNIAFDLNGNRKSIKIQS